MMSLSLMPEEPKYVVVVLTLTRIIKAVVTGLAPVTPELRNTQGKKTHTTQGGSYTHTSMSQLTQFMPPPETYKSEIGSQSAMCQVQAGAYVSLFFLFFFFAHFYFPASGQAVVAGVIPSPPRFLPSIFIAHRVQQSHCSSIVHRGLLTHALALSASQSVHKKKSQRIYTSMHCAGLQLTKLTYTRLEDNLIRHRGDRSTLTTHAWRNQIFQLPPKEDYHVDITRGIYHYAYARQA